MKAHSMKKIPGVGFIYLVVVFASFSLFICWIARPAWYDRIHSPLKREEDVVRWAEYLENIAADFSGANKRVEILKEAAELRTRLNQPEKAWSNLERALGISPGDVRLKARKMMSDFKTGRIDAAVKGARELWAAGERSREMASILLADQATRTDRAWSARLIAYVAAADIPGKRVFSNGEVVALGFTADFWTLDGAPGYLAVRGLPDRPCVRELWAECYAAPGYMPVTVTMKDDVHEVVHVFRKPGRVLLTLPAIPPGEDRIFVVRTDKTWTPKGDRDKRRLGVRIRVKE